MGDTEDYIVVKSFLLSVMFLMGSTNVPYSLSGLCVEMANVHVMMMSFVCLTVPGPQAPFPAAYLVNVLT